MKKIIICVMTFIMTVVLTGCIKLPVNERVYSVEEEITAIEVYFFEEPVYWDKEERCWYYETWNEETEEYDITVCEQQPIAYVAKADYSSFLADANDLPYTITVIIGAAMDPVWFYEDYVVRIVSGEKDEIVCNKSGGDLAYCKEEIWQDFLKKYIGEEVFNR